MINTDDDIAPRLTVQTSPYLGELDLPSAPPVARAAPAPMRAPRVPALLLVGLGVILTFGPIAGGLFAKVASGKQLIDDFAPHLDADALARDTNDLVLLRNGAVGVNDVYRRRGISPGRYPGLDAYRRQSTAIDGRATGLLDRVSAAVPDYRRVAAVGGFDRIPFLVVVCGLVAIYGGCVLLAGHRERARGAVLLVVLAGAALAVYPFVSDLPSGASSGERLLPALAPVMTATEVRQLQRDFVVLVQADGELDTSFRSVPKAGTAAAQITAMVTAWPTISSDLASLVGTINDNIGNYDALHDLDVLPRRAGLSGLAGLPWLLVGAGSACAALAVAGLPRRRKEAR